MRPCGNQSTATTHGKRTRGCGWWNFGGSGNARAKYATRSYAAPPVPRVDPEWLAGVIRLHSPHDAVYALAEKIAEAINGRRNELETD